MRETRISQLVMDDYVYFFNVTFLGRIRWTLNCGNARDRDFIGRYLDGE